MSLALRRAEPRDAELVFALVRELAEYEKLTHEVVAKPEDIANALFAPEPRLSCDIAEWHGEPAGFSVWFLNFSTFRGRHGVYLEDVFVRPAFRGRGIGTALLKQLARHCVDNGYARFEWAVLDWNVNAMSFYESLGATVLPDWRIVRVTGPALDRLAAPRALITDHEPGNMNA